jgi:acetyl esterase
MPLDPQVKALRAAMEQTGACREYPQPIETARTADRASTAGGSGPAEPVGRVAEQWIPGPAGDLRVRIYWPHDAGQGRLPLLVYFFGGGWSLGSLDTSDGTCRKLANAAGCVTVSVAYRLAPEHRFPAAVWDCHAATEWAAEAARDLGADPGRIAVGGDSSGGNLAAAVALACRDNGRPRLVHQLLVYPNTDYLADTRSLREGTDPYFFNRAAVDWYWSLYLADPDDGANPLASPLRAPDLRDLPSATVITAEYDPLRDEGEQYALKMRAAGVPTELVRFDGMIHGFFTMTGSLNGARQAVALAASRLRTAFGAELAR